MTTRIDISNKRQVLVYPTKLRIKFWLLYCKNKLYSEIENKVDLARNKLIEYDAMEDKKRKFEINISNDNAD